MQTYLGIGVMTGTSLDGIDLAACLFTEKEGTYEVEIQVAETIPLELKWRDRLAKLVAQDAEIYAKTHTYFGHYLGQNIQDFIAKHALKPDFVAVHGQTIFHQPDKNFTAQIGDGETIVTYLNCPLVSNFRSKDVALGGQGAPLVPFGEKYLFPDSKLNLNLGGFANMSYGNLGFDIAPCNIVMNSLVKLQYPDLGFDEDGKFAAAGNVVEALRTELNQLPFYKTPPPKSLGWEWTAENVFPIFRKHQPSLEDGLCTYIEHVTDQIARAIKHIQARNEKIVITGGGRHNPFLMSKLKDKIAVYDIEIAENIGNEMIDFKEAIIFAFLGLRTLTNLPNTLTEVTGASMAAVSGAIHLPTNGWKNLLAK